MKQKKEIKKCLVFHILWFFFNLLKAHSSPHPFSFLLAPWNPQTVSSWQILQVLYLRRYWRMMDTVIFLYELPKATWSHCLCFQVCYRYLKLNFKNISEVFSKGARTDKDPFVLLSLGWFLVQESFDSSRSCFLFADNFTLWKIFLGFEN